MSLLMFEHEQEKQEVSIQMKDNYATFEVSRISLFSYWYSPRENPDLFGQSLLTWFKANHDLDHHLP